ncbi:MAG: hypothetical protein ACSLE1_03130 [Sphingobium sp.]
MSDQGAIGNTLAFFASVIKSGEPWTETCQRDYAAAQNALTAMAVEIERLTRALSEIAEVDDDGFTSDGHERCVEWATRATSRDAAK